MSLKVLCAGCSPQEREAVEAEVAAALGARARNDPWTVSLVKIGDRWSVTLEGPDRATRGKGFMAPQDGLRQSIAAAVGEGSGAGPSHPGSSHPAPRRPTRATPAVVGAQGERRDRHACSKCRRSYDIVYEAEAGEPTETVPVACPRCWQIDHVTVGQSAGLSSDYRVEPVE